MRPRGSLCFQAEPKKRVLVGRGPSCVAHFSPLRTGTCKPLAPRRRRPARDPAAALHDRRPGSPFPDQLQRRDRNTILASICIRHRICARKPPAVPTTASRLPVSQRRATGQVLLHSPSALRRAFHAVVNPRDPDVKVRTPLPAAGARTGLGGTSRFVFVFFFLKIRSVLVVVFKLQTKNESKTQSTTPNPPAQQ